MSCLLIVPCGIETLQVVASTSWVELLIVPCGIETRIALISTEPLFAFNRTLWN